MRSGYWVVAAFATGWASAGLLATGYPPAIILLPALVSAAILFWAFRVPATGGELGAPTRRLLARWSLIEGLAIVVAINLLARTHHREAAFPVVAMIVGAHFVPLARRIPMPVYYLTATGLVLIGCAGLLVPAPARPLVVGLGAAGVLWATALSRLIEASRSGGPARVGRGAGS